MPAYDDLLHTVLDREPDPAGGIRGADVDYEVDGTACTGYLAVPADVAGPVPGVLVVHDWLGVADVVRMRCDMLARLGYAAFAADIYGADTRPSPAEAPAVSGRFYGDTALWRKRVIGAYDRMVSEEAVDPARTAAIGYCFGGSTALQLARAGVDVNAVVSFHGGLSAGPEGEAAGIRAKVLILTGAADPVVPDSAVQAVQDEFRTAPDLDWQVVTYAGAMHAFAVPGVDAPSHGAQYQETADRRSWLAMKDFFAEVL